MSEHLFSVPALVEHRHHGVGKVISHRGEKIVVKFPKLGHANNEVVFREAEAPLKLIENPTDEMQQLFAGGDSRKTAKPKKKVVRTIAHADDVQRFQSEYPQGFQDPKYLKHERGEKLQQHELWNQSLGKEQFDELLQRDDWKEIADRLWKVVTVNQLISRFERPLLKACLDDEGHCRAFVRALRELVYGDGEFEQRFTGFAEMLSTLPAQGTKSPFNWPTQTLFPFLAAPEDHVLLKPTAAKKFAERRGRALDYDTTPNWRTYSLYQNLCRDTRDQLCETFPESGPQDMIDVQSFIYFANDQDYKIALSAAGSATG